MQSTLQTSTLAQSSGSKMMEIKFDIDSTEYSVDINSPRNDPNVAYNSQGKIAEEVQAAGYEFVDSPPKPIVLIRAHRKGADDSVIDLGDITGKVDPIDGGEKQEPDEEPISSADDDPATVDLTLIGPGGEETHRTYKETQNIGSVALDIKSVHEVGRKKRVVLYRSRERQRQYPNEAPLADMDGETLYWELTERD